VVAERISPLGGVCQENGCDFRIYYNQIYYEPRVNAFFMTPAA
jgi:hypothetical protein